MVAAARRSLCMVARDDGDGINPGTRHHELTVGPLWAYEVRALEVGRSWLSPAKRLSMPRSCALAMRQNNGGPIVTVARG